MPSIKWPSFKNYVNTAKRLVRLARLVAQRWLIALGVLAGLGVSAVGLSGCGGSDPAPTPSTPTQLVVTTNVIEPITAQNLALLQGTEFTIPAGAFPGITAAASTLRFYTIAGATVAPGATEATLQLAAPTFTLDVGGANPTTLTGTMRFGSCIFDFPNGFSFTMNPCGFQVDSAGKRTGTETVANLSSQFIVTSPSGEKSTFNGQGKPITGFTLTWTTDANGASTFVLKYQNGLCVAPGGCAPLRGSSGNVNLPNATLARITGVVRVSVTPVTGGSGF